MVLMVLYKPLSVFRVLASSSFKSVFLELLSDGVVKVLFGILLLLLLLLLLKVKFTLEQATKFHRGE